ncbi:MAG: DUF362 domain-containing protein [Lentisphaerae bacterium]|nr:DUF362 domain-containing protein [Lentisphaerota bacterium]
MNRRDFLKTTFLGILASGAAGRVLQAADPTALPDLVALHNSTPEAMFARGMQAIGGMERFVKKGSTVVVKPNIAWDQPPEFAANTNPELVAAIVKSVYQAGAASVIVFDHSCDNGPACYRKSGIAEAAENAGAKVLHATNKKHYRKVTIPNAKVMSEAEIFEAILDCDTFINVPILKHHGGARMSAAMKNLMGIVWDRRKMHRAGLGDSIPDLLSFRKPDLNILDAYRMIMDHGPRGGTLKDVALGKFMLISPDAVATDAVAVKLMKYKASEVQYLIRAAERKLGERKLSQLKIASIEM